MQEGHRIGEPVSVPLAEISDWAYRAPDGVMQGHRTTRVLFPQFPAELTAAITRIAPFEVSVGHQGRLPLGLNALAVAGPPPATISPLGR